MLTAPPSSTMGSKQVGGVRVAGYHCDGPDRATGREGAGRGEDGEEGGGEIRRPLALLA